MRRPSCILSGAFLLFIVLVAASCGSGAASPTAVERGVGGPTGSYVVPAGIHKIKHVIVIQQ